MITKVKSDPRVLQERIARLERIVEIGQLLNSTLNLPQLLEDIIQTIIEILETERASILLVDERTGELFFAAASESSPETLRKIKVPIDGSIAGTIYQNREPLVVDDVSEDSRHYSGVDQSISFHTRSLMGVPMMVRDRCIGVLEAINKTSQEPFTQEDVEVLTSMASHAAVAIENARLVSRLREANRRLAELDQLKSNFISIASHELRTPLMIVQGYASFLRHNATGDMGEDLDMVLHGAKKLQTIIDQMTNLNYLESGLSELDQEDVIIQELIQEMAHEWQALTTAKEQRLTTNLPATPIAVHIDRSKIALVLSNLLSNAVKFTPQRGDITISAMPRTGRVVVTVADTGVGIPEEHLERIFDSFYQVEDHLTRQHSGLGLGLTIAKTIVEEHGGRIWAESTPEQGTEINFTVPISSTIPGAEDSLR